MPETRPRIVVMGGGTGCPTVLEGLKGRAGDLAAVVTTMDSGGSSGRLRREFGVPALGDLRRALGALAGEGEGAFPPASLWEYRYGGESPLAGHVLGNLLLLAMVDVAGGLEAGIDEMARLAGARGRVLPVTLGAADLCALLQDGSTLVGEEAIDGRGPSPVGIERVYLSPSVAANPPAVVSILGADAVVLAPGDLYTSLLPNLLVQGIAEAVRASGAWLVAVGNLETKPGETEGYRLSDFLRTVVRYLGLARPLDAVVLDSGDVEGEGGGAPPQGRSPRVEQDMEACQGLARRFLRRPVARRDSPWLHDPGPTGRAVMEAIEALEGGPGPAGRPRA